VGCGREGAAVAASAERVQLRKWRNVLAINRRLRSVGAGPYSIHTTTTTTEKDNNTHLLSINWGHRVVEAAGGGAGGSTSGGGSSGPGLASYSLVHDELDDYNPTIWRSYCENVIHRNHPSASSAAAIAAATKTTRTKREPVPHKKISFSSLYPDCDLVTNQAVRLYQPVPVLLVSKAAPVQLFYGY
jgi:hypothetical protein